MSEPITIQQSKRKESFMILLCIAFALVGIGIIYFSNDLEKLGIQFRSHPFNWEILGYTFIAVGLIAIIYILTQMMSKKPGMVISDDGILYNWTISKAKLISWDEIKEIKEGVANVSVLGQVISMPNIEWYKILIPVLKDPFEYINKQKGFLMKDSARINYDKYGSPVYFSPQFLKCNYYELKDILFKKFNEMNKLVVIDNVKPTLTHDNDQQIPDYSRFMPKANN